MSEYKRADNIGSWIFQAGLVILAAWVGYQIYESIQGKQIVILPPEGGK